MGGVLAPPSARLERNRAPRTALRLFCANNCARCAEEAPARRRIERPWSSGSALPSLLPSSSPRRSSPSWSTCRIARKDLPPEAVTRYRVLRRSLMTVIIIDRSPLGAPRRPAGTRGRRWAARLIGRDRHRRRSRRAAAARQLRRRARDRLHPAASASAIASRSTTSPGRSRRSGSTTRSSVPIPTPGS